MYEMCLQFDYLIFSKQDRQTQERGPHSSPVDLGSPRFTSAPRSTEPILGACAEFRNATPTTLSFPLSLAARFVFSLVRVAIGVRILSFRLVVHCFVPFVIRQPLRWQPLILQNHSRPHSRNSSFTVVITNQKKFD